MEKEISDFKFKNKESGDRSQNSGEKEQKRTKKNFFYLLATDY
jgi:hypothetical protein